jgi:hypothetical protein
MGGMVRFCHQLCQPGLSIDEEVLLARMPMPFWRVIMIFDGLVGKKMQKKPFECGIRLI